MGEQPNEKGWPRMDASGKRKNAMEIFRGSLCSSQADQ